MIIDDIMNHLADMPGQTLPVYGLQFPDDVMNCVAIFPAGGGVQANIGVSPGMYAATSSTTGYMDYPGVQIQVRYTDPYNAFKIAEDIRQWLDNNLPTGYVICSTMRSVPDCLTSTSDLAMIGGPCHRYSVDFGFVHIR